jgi:hypothetical protein
MRGIKLVTTPLAVMALSAVIAAAASAAPEFLSNIGSRAFTGSSKKAKLQVKEGATIECTKSKASGLLTSNTTGLLTVAFEGCKSLGLAASSLGDVPGVILVTLTAETCFAGLFPALEAGLILTPSPVHIEVPAASQLMIVKGAFVAMVEPTNFPFHSSQLVIAQKGGVQSIDGCRNEANELDNKSLLTWENEEVNKKAEPVLKQSGVEAVESSLIFTEPSHTEELMV